ncbi:MAG TPA: MerR family transcriptional regulator [Actinomycetota bacterium]|jgi:DNA-binding transcriptional MerR regulator|nr:MerR family transcriptional regulator [Actinomycetota bacterium]
MAESDGYRVPEVCKLVGITYRQLDYWARTGLVNPSVREAGGSGTQRLYSFRDLVQLKVIKKLLDAGVSLQNVRKAVVYLRQHLGTEPASVTLMSDGARIYACESEDEIIDLVKRGQGVFAIALDKVWDDLSSSLKPKREARPRVARAGGA